MQLAVVDRRPIARRGGSVVDPNVHRRAEKRAMTSDDSRRNQAQGRKLVERIAVRRRQKSVAPKEGAARKASRDGRKGKGDRKTKGGPKAGRDDGADVSES